MRIVLHAGFHKTGTTSLQVTLDAHRAALAGFVHFETPQGTPHLSRAAEAARGFCLTGDARALAQGMGDWVARLPPLSCIARRHGPRRVLCCLMRLRTR